MTMRRCTDVTLKDLFSFAASYSTSYQTPAICADQRLVVDDHSRLQSTTAQRRLPSLYAERYTHRATGWTGRPHEWAPSAVHSHFVLFAHTAIYGPCMLWPNHWMDQDATWYGGRHWPRRQNIPTNFQARYDLFYVKSAVKLQQPTDLGDIVLDVDPALPQKRRHSSPHPHFQSHVLWPNGWMDQDATWYGARPRPRRHCVRWGPSPP